MVVMCDVILSVTVLTLTFTLCSHILPFFPFLLSPLQSRTDMSPEEVVSLQLALVDLALRVYTDKIHYVDKVLQHTVDIFNARDITK